VALMLLAVLSGQAIAAADDAQQLQLEVYIEGASTNIIAEILRRADGRFAARRSELREIGVAVPGQGKDDEIIDFDNIPGLGMRYDEPAQKLHLNLVPELRLARDYSADGANGLVLKPQTEVSREYGSVLNYTLFGTAARGYTSNARIFTTGAVTLDHRIFSPFGVVQNSGIAGTTLSREGVLRLDSSYRYAHRESSTLVTAGDAISGGLAWTRPIRFVTAPLPSVSGSAAVPSTVDVYVDNIRIASRDVGAGPFRISGLPVPGESGTARVVVRDVTGRETVTSVPFFTSSKLLAAGQFDYSINAGLPRQNYAVKSFDYTREAMGMSSVRYGFSDKLTLEAHAEGTRTLLTGGLGTTFSAGMLGLFSVAGAASRTTSGATGGLFHASWELGLRGVFLGASTLRTMGDFEDVASVTAPRTAKGQTTNFLDSGFFSFNASGSGSPDGRSAHPTVQCLADRELHPCGAAG
jgi:outer membrane usher protein